MPHDDVPDLTVLGELGVRVSTLEAAMREVVGEAEVSARLERGVERLADETSGLTGLLERVDEQQRRIAVVTKKVDAVEAHTVPREELEHERRTTRRLLVASSLLVALIAFALTFGLSEAAHDSCEKRQESTRTLIELLEGFRVGGPTDEGIILAQQRLAGTLMETCDQQYVLHL